MIYIWYYFRSGFLMLFGYWIIAAAAAALAQRKFTGRSSPAEYTGGSSPAESTGGSFPAEFTGDSFPAMWARRLRGTFLRFIGGVLLATVILLYFPRPYAAALFGGRGAGQVLMGILFGIPASVCGAGTILIAREWMRQGMSTGCAAAFLLAGPAVKIFCLRMRKRSPEKLAVYIADVLIFAIAAVVMLAGG